MSKKISLILGGGGVSATKTKVSGNCLKWINPVSENFPIILGGGGFSGIKTKVAGNCLKWINPVSKKFPHGGGGLFCHKNQSCQKLPEMDRSSVKIFSLILEVGDFSGTKTKVAGNCLKWINPVSKNFPSSLGGGSFSATKPKLLELPGMDRSSVKNFSSSWGGGFSASQNQSCWKLPEMDKSSQKFSFILGGGFSASCPMGCSMMHEIWFGKVTSHLTIQAEYLTRRQKGGGGGLSADLRQVEVLPVE